jgi:hypothetical protein
MPSAGWDEAIALAKKRAGIAAETEVEVVNYPARKTLFELLAEQISGSGNQRDMQMDLRLVTGLLGAGERHALEMLTAPVRLFNRNEPLALMSVGYMR